jgi:hypothetical protein
MNQYVQAIFDMRRCIRFLENAVDFYLLSNKLRSAERIDQAKLLLSHAEREYHEYIAFRVTQEISEKCWK